MAWMIKAMTKGLSWQVQWLQKIWLLRPREVRPFKESTTVSFWCVIARTCASSRAASIWLKNNWRRWSLDTASLTQPSSVIWKYDWHKPFEWAAEWAGYIQLLSVSNSAESTGLMPYWYDDSVSCGWLGMRPSISVTAGSADLMRFALGIWSWVLVSVFSWSGERPSSGWFEVLVGPTCIEVAGVIPHREINFDLLSPISSELGAFIHSHCT